MSLEETEFHFNCINRSKVCREMMRLAEEKKKKKQELGDNFTRPRWTEADLYNQLIGQLQDLIY